MTCNVELRIFSAQTVNATIYYGSVMEQTIAVIAVMKKAVQLLVKLLGCGCCLFNIIPAQVTFLCHGHGNRASQQGLHIPNFVQTKVLLKPTIT